ncbi:MAG TPA: glycosyl hydrolase family 28 protein, partial [Verrucomicrobiae bacterium]|nr:glycosyl hydrolase family 28 protein [Verrucomicrobiae bacterium]
MRKLKFAAILLSVASGVGVACAQSQFPPPQPTIPAGIYNVTNYGAVGDGSTINTTAIQNAIAAAVASAAKGGTVEIPGPGTYLSGPLTMKSSINLQVDAGATLQMLPYASWPGTTTFITGSGLHDVEISGAGAIDGQGTDWWNAYNSNKISRPNFINFSGTTRILIQNITLQNPPTFHLMLKGNNANITIQGITINTPGAPGVAPNTDGMDLASTNVLVRNCSISDGDDNIEIGGSQPCAYVTVTNCSFGFGHGVSIGSITSGGVSNVLVTDCTFTNTSNGIRMKSDNDRGGIVQNLSYRNLTMTNVGYPVTIYSYYNEVG